METEQLNKTEQQNLQTAVSADKPGKSPSTIKKGKAKVSKSAKEPVVAKKKAAKPRAEVKHEAAAKKTVKAKAVKQAATAAATKIIFQLRFHTKPGQSLFVAGSHAVLGNGDIAHALPLQYLNEETWAATADINAASVPEQGIGYNYVLKMEDGSVIYDWGEDKKLTPELFTYKEVFISDSWNFAGYYDNAFYTEPFQNVLLKNNHTEVKTKEPKKFTHIFRIKAPLLKKGETICLLGDAEETGRWTAETPVLLSRKAGEDFHSVALDLAKIDFPLIYKYGIYDSVHKKFLQYEDGKNRVLFQAHAAAKNKISIINDGFIVLPDNTWKGAGVSIPVFSLRSKNSWGVGEFADIKLLVDWAEKTGLRLIQILPVNDTHATGTWSDSYPYAAISAFALHPMYINPDALASKKNKKILKAAKAERSALNEKDTVDYEAVNNLKWKLLKELYALQKKETFASAAFKDFYKKNRHWLEPYSAFCYYRDLYNTSDFNNWPANNIYNADDVTALFDSAKTADDVLLHCFVQYHLHVQLQEAAAYAHEHGVIIKGDIAIGIYRYGADAWQRPDLFNMHLQAGAPPDDFAVKGQNWGFPTYNWQKMEADGFAWWRQRFEQMSYYFDAFRIDHILGFFRIWSIPMHAVEGIMGHFEPCMPVHINEFNQRNIWFDYVRYTQPYITDQLLHDEVGDEAEHFKQTYLQPNGNGTYSLLEEYATQRKVEAHFAAFEATEHDNWVKQKLFDLISNIILFEAEGTNGQQFHFRFSVEATRSFQYLNQHTQNQLKELYVDYFFRRQDEFWKKEALKKLPALKRATNMLICGEDLGLVPGSVPEVMKDLGLLSLEIQRMPKQIGREFFHPSDAPYLSVVTPSTHDMSTIRGWWEEDRAKTQRFFNYQLGLWGEAPHSCEPWISRAVIVQHVYAPAMWSIFQMQDLLGISEGLRRPNPIEERINVPAIPRYYWRYRMHVLLEDLLNADEFNAELHGIMEASGRTA
ncbi:4-alpha-glucanotransferase [Parafilimonas sp.]|uniref:4-alpha-glucanotransferase n=1 Tax=Parafilimonas sp. TaxID=1969739 RepID=UPI0039E2FE11